MTWITQLVVHEDFRRQGVAKNLLFSIWSFSDHFAWGIVSANPFAVRALEKATRRRCVPARINKHRDVLLALAMQHVPYVSRNTATLIQNDASRINTSFFLDHSRVEQMITDATSQDAPWLLGELRPGWEWCAFTFSDQEQLQLTPEEVDAMLHASDDVVRHAYSRMALDTGHRWTKHAASESEFILRHCNLGAGATVLDFGCGKGRHAIELAARGCQVTGVDYLPQFIKSARDAAFARCLFDATFLEGDCRSIRLGKSFDAVVCLYDVVGTYAASADNFKILRNIATHLSPGGSALISVMNRRLTERRAKHRFTLSSDPNRLLSLQPSHAMESTGNVFDPDYYMIDTETGIVYRKEQFDRGNLLPAELIVRDRRYLPDEIAKLCYAVGLCVDWTRCVRAGDWDTDLGPDHDRAKEVLVLCRKPK